MKTETQQDQVYGLSTRDLLKKLDRSTSSSRMLEICSVTDLQESSKILMKSGMMRNGTLFQLETLELAIYEKDSGLLPTPTASHYGTSQNGQRSDGTTYKQKGKPSLETMARNGTLLLPTPTVSDAKDGFGSAESAEKWAENKTVDVLTSYCVKNHPRETFPTPTTFDSGDPLPPRKKNNSGGQRPPLVSVIGGKLNPQFVEWLMGYPQDYTKVSHLESKESDNWEML